jgi:hypothetical protein
LFVVRIDREDEKPDFKVFVKRSDAEARFRAAAPRVWEHEFAGAALFEVLNTTDARAALEAVKAGDKTMVRLLDKEPTDINVDDLDLSGII